MLFLNKNEKKKKNLDIKKANDFTMHTYNILSIFLYYAFILNMVYYIIIKRQLIFKFNFI